MKDPVNEELLLSEDQHEKTLKLFLRIKKILNVILFSSFSWLSYLLWNMFFRSLVLMMSGIQLSSVRELKKLTAHNSIELEIAADPLTFLFLSAIIVSTVPIYYLFKIFKRYWLN
ncbi:hypothetical protein [Elizabethkingia anophelis]|uniref:hypothetical protein n=1 Tax=Elizabethkingia anophelis TaxID=1117645 RepID=UPI000995AA1A|nr:hypothetical protein [Elizabethkingia anophelis]AQW92946.1 hypothetical protein BBD30_01435 [Elizabethkingia anophelis]MDV3917704.1 hypothetical protein [Elizabethkingia anophelis]MDV4095651.1 hypothetical protein [Elizabethkingia anophelis]OPB61442.1 hypothetical protein BAS07_16825 [Elizabethkingia anophelis]HAY3591743.1 hypothetical protein [Elizabethkingia anophelis]